MLSKRPYLFKAVIVSPPPKAEKAPLLSIAGNIIIVQNLVLSILKPCMGIIMTFINRFVHYRDYLKTLI